MNIPPDAENPAESRQGDILLDARLHTYFQARTLESLPLEAFWQRLAPHIEHDARSGDVDGIPNTSPERLRSMTTVDLPRADVVPANVSHSRPVRRVIGNLLAIVAVLAICLSAFVLFHQQGTPVPGNGQTIQRGQLSWQKVNLPAGVVLAEGDGVRVTRNGTPIDTPIDTGQPKDAPAPNATYQVAASNGAVAYICQIAADGSPRLWRTTDAGQRWTRLPDLPGHSSITACGMSIDGNDPLTVLIGISDQATGNLAYALFDGTNQWQQRDQVLWQFASWRDVYYGVGGPAPVDSQHPAHLYISTDHMQTWQKVNDTKPIAENTLSAKISKTIGPVGVSQVAVQPNTGELLVQTYDGALWRSTDQGQNWTRITFPPLPPTSELTPSPGEMSVEGGPTDAIVFIQRPVAGQRFTLCAMVFHQEVIAYNVAPLYCSHDSGQTWTRRPRTAVEWGHGKPASFEVPQLMLSDGSLLAWDVQTISIFPGANTSGSAAHVIGAIPPPRNPGNIPGGKAEATPDGVILWQPHDPTTLYVAHYRVATGA